MSVDRWATASLRIFSDSMTPEALAEAVDFRAVEFYRIGDRVSPRSRSTAVRETNGLFISSGLTTESCLEEHIEALLAKIEQAREGLRSLQGRAKMDLFCGFSSSNGQGGFTLSSALLTRIAALGLDLSLDLYPPSVDEVVNATPDL